MDANRSGVAPRESASSGLCALFAEEWLAHTLEADAEQTGRAAGDAPRRSLGLIGSSLRSALTDLACELFGAFDRIRVGALVDWIVRLRVAQGVAGDAGAAFVDAGRRAAIHIAGAGSPEAAPAPLRLARARLDVVEKVAADRLAHCRAELRAIAERAARRRSFVAERAQARAVARPARRRPPGSPSPGEGLS